MAIEIISNADVDYFLIDEFYNKSPQNTDEERCLILNQVFYIFVKENA